MANKKKKVKPISARRRKQINLLISQKARLRSVNKKIDKIKYGTPNLTLAEKRPLINNLLNDGVKINTEISKLEKKTGARKKNNFRNVKKDPKKLNLVLGKVWEKNDIEKYIFESGSVNSINKKEIGDSDDEILDLLNKCYQQMGSTDYIQLQIDKDGNAILSIVNADEIEDDEFDIN